jgi:hypothetical protein
MNYEKEKKFCKKLIYVSQLGGQQSPTVLLGIVLLEEENFIIFKTRNNTYTINKKYVESISETKEEFEERGY